MQTITAQKTIAPRRETELYPVIGLTPARRLHLLPGAGRKYQAAPVHHSSGTSRNRMCDWCISR